MPTPAYVPHSSANLTGSTTGPNVPVNAQSNDNAIMDEVTMMGALAWAPTFTYTSGKVTQAVNAKGVYRTRVDITYVAAGPAIGKVDTMIHYWSNDSGATWALRTDSGVTLGKLTMTYDGSGNLTGGTWS